MARPTPKRDAATKNPAAMTVLSTLYLDDDEDTLEALHAAAMRTARSRAVATRDRGLAAMPTSLAAWTTSSRWPAATRRPRRRIDREAQWMMGTVFSAAIAVLLVLSAVLWRLERPLPTPREHTPASIAAPRTAGETVDTISGASRR